MSALLVYTCVYLVHKIFLHKHVGCVDRFILVGSLLVHDAFNRGHT